MARHPRFDLAGVAQHVVHRGNNRLPCFLDDDDRQRYLQCSWQALSRFDCRLHAYVMMSNQVHLLLTPCTAGAGSRLMHTFARNYAVFFNARHGRTGAVWEGRYKACLVDSGHYFLTCSRYIELNPACVDGSAARRLSLVEPWCKRRIPRRHVIGPASRVFCVGRRPTIQDCCLSGAVRRCAERRRGRGNLNLSATAKGVGH